MTDANGKVCNAIEGNDLDEGLIGAFVSGAVYGAMTVSPLVKSSIGPYINVVASYASVAAGAMEFGFIRMN